MLLHDMRPRGDAEKLAMIKINPLVIQGRLITMKLYPITIKHMIPIIKGHIIVIKGAIFTIAPRSGRSSRRPEARRAPRLPPFGPREASLLTELAFGRLQFFVCVFVMLLSNCILFFGQLQTYQMCPRSRTPHAADPRASSLTQAREPTTARAPDTPRRRADRAALDPSSELGYTMLYHTTLDCTLLYFTPYYTILYSLPQSLAQGLADFATRDATRSAPRYGGAQS